VNISIYLYIIAISIIVGLVRFNELKPTFLKWMVPFLLLTLAVEITGLIMSRHDIYNLWMYNFFTSFEFVFYSLLYRAILANSFVKKIIVYAVIVYLVLFVINISFIQGFYKLHTITYRIGSIMAVTWCYLYFRQLMKSEIYIPVFRDPLFWISTGLLFFYAGFFFYMTAGDIVLYAHIPYNTLVWDVISDSLNALLYTCFLISFVCQKTIRTYSL